MSQFPHLYNENNNNSYCTWWLQWLNKFINIDLTVPAGFTTIVNIIKNDINSREKKKMSKCWRLLQMKRNYWEFSIWSPREGVAKKCPSWNVSLEKHRRKKGLEVAIEPAGQYSHPLFCSTYTGGKPSFHLKGL